MMLIQIIQKTSGGLGVVEKVCVDEKSWGCVACGKKPSKPLSTGFSGVHFNEKYLCSDCCFRIWEIMTIDMSYPLRNELFKSKKNTKGKYWPALFKLKK